MLRRTNEQVAEEARPKHPRAAEWWDYHVNLEEGNERLREECQRHIVDLTVLGHRVEFLERELAKVKRERDTFQRGYIEFLVKLTDIEAPIKSVIEGAKAAMIRDGVIPSAATADALDDGAAQIGRRFAAQPNIDDMLADVQPQDVGARTNE
jgi:hypothetical protein